MDDMERAERILMRVISSDSLVLEFAAVRAEALAVYARSVMDCIEMAPNSIAAHIYRDARAPLEARIATLTAQNERLTAALRECVSDLIWCSGSNDFSPDGQARVGWLKGPAESIERGNAALARIANEPLDAEQMSEVAQRALTGSPCGVEKPKKEERDA
mgnify:CR=1 FL=1